MAFKRDSRIAIKPLNFGVFPGGALVRSLPCRGGGHGSIPVQGTDEPLSADRKKKKKVY